MPRSQRSKRMARIGTVLAVLLVVFFLSIPLMAGVLSRFVPDSVEDEVGKQLIGEVAKNAKFCRSDAGMQALDDLVEKLAKANGDDSTYKVYVVDEDVMNAFAAPGGHVVIFHEIIKLAETPDEVAGVLAHEMAHVSEGHPSRGLVEAMGYGVFRLLNPGGGAVGSEVAQAVIATRYSRDDELDADRVGVATLNNAGLNSKGLNDFFDRMAEAGQEIPGALEFLSTHPTGDHRKKQLEELTQDGDTAMSDADWQALKQVCQDTGEPLSVGNA